MRLAAVAFVLCSQIGCKAEAKECPPADPKQAGIDPMLVDALCALSLTPGGQGGGQGEAGVLSDGKRRYPWIVRRYDARFVDLAEVEQSLEWLKKRGSYRGALPSTLCPGVPAQVSIVFHNAEHNGKQGAWILGGEITAPKKTFVEGTSDDDRMKSTVALIKEALGDRVRVEWLQLDGSTKTTGVGGGWERLFEE